MNFTPLYVSLLTVAGGLSLRNYLRLEVEGRGRLVLTRLLGVLLLMVVLLAPAWVRSTTERLKPVIRVLVDASTSMQREAWPGGPSRYARANSAVEAIRDRYGDGFEYKLQAFDSSVRDGGFPATAEGVGTDLARALHQSLRRDDERTRALLLLSDGRSTRGASPVLSARSASFPIHALGLGAAEDPRPNIQVLGIDVPEEGFAGGEVKVTARVAFQRVPAGTRVPLELRVGGEVVQTGSVAATEGETSVVLRFLPRNGGLQPVVVKALPGETLRDRAREDDVAESSMRVRAEPIPVLLLGGRPGPDLAFTRRVLRDDPRFRLRTIFGFSPTRPVALPPPGDPFSLEKVPLVVVSGFEAGRFPVAVQSELLAYLQERQGAILLLSNGPREWADLFRSKLGTVLPYLAPQEYQPLEKRYGVDPKGVDDHLITRILEHEQANRQAWQRLPPIAPGLNLKAATGTRTFLSIPYYPRNLPLLVGRNVRRGILLAMNTRESYLWAMLPAAHGDPENVHERFTARLAAWAADPARVGGERLEISKLRHAPGETVRVAWKGPATSRPSVLELAPLKPGEKPRLLQMGAAEGGGVAEFDAPPPGFYEVRQPGRGAAPISLAVHASREELLKPDPDHGVLRDVADAAGGSFLPLGQDVSLEALPRVDTTPVVRPHNTGIYWLDEPLVLIAVLLLFCLEWGMRRRRNLV